jgi:hypothetical protein
VGAEEGKGSRGSGETVGVPPLLSIETGVDESGFFSAFRVVAIHIDTKISHAFTVLCPPASLYDNAKGATDAVTTK